jgi:nucleoside-triphosphatase THEP1|eukprot:gnl/Ergobibamus_cyprinoides/1195.p1 GENE.gnl/Ergobibamus_cyprinoides/1195~~gnl/Ergobibamus_cyprinoides/1195.p1  ORF type:complete len:200 (+),score=44.53 gnl/Ergobibamus_cyprinoides/1195:485-1084(+)
MPVFAVTGTPNSGKTTRLYGIIQARPDAFAGLLALPVFSNGAKSFSYVDVSLPLLPLAPGELPAVPTHARPSTPTSGTDCVQCGPFSLSLSAFAFANGVLEAAAASNRPNIVLDEVGPLELARHEGLLPGLNAAVAAVVSQPSRNLLCVVRARLLPQFAAFVTSAGLAPTVLDVSDPAHLQLLTHSLTLGDSMPATLTQ